MSSLATPTTARSSPLWGRYVKSERKESLTVLDRVANTVTGAVKTVFYTLGLIPAVLILPPARAAGYRPVKAVAKKVQKSAIATYQASWKGKKSEVEYRSADIVEEKEDSKEVLKDVDKEIGMLMEHLKESTTELEQARSDFKKAQEQNASKETIKALAKEIKDYETKIKQIKQQMEVLEKRARLLEQQTKDDTVLAGLEKDLKESTTELEQARSDFKKAQEQNASKETIKALAKEIEDYETKIKQIKQQMEVLEKKAELLYQHPDARFDNDELRIFQKAQNYLPTNEKLKALEAKRGALLIKEDELKTAASKKEIKEKRAEIEALKNEIKEDYRLLRECVEKLARGSRCKAKIEGYKALESASAESKLKYIRSLGHANYDPEIRQSIADYVRQPGVELFESDNHLYRVDTAKGGFIFIPNGKDVGADWDSSITFIRVYDQETGEAFHDGENLSRIARSFMTAHGRIEEWKKETAAKLNEEHKDDPKWKSVTAKDFKVHELVLDFKGNNCYALPEGYNPNLPLHKQGVPVKLGDEAWQSIHKLLRDKETEHKPPLQERAHFQRPSTSHRGESSDEDDEILNLPTRSSSPSHGGEPSSQNGYVSDSPWTDTDHFYYSGDEDHSLPPNQGKNPRVTEINDDSSTDYEPADSAKDD